MAMTKKRDRREYNKRYRAEHPDYWAVWEENNRERRRKQKRDYMRRQAALGRQWPEHKRTAEQQRWDHLKYRYKMTQEQYEALLAAQEGVCASCSTSEPGGKSPLFEVDHDHDCCPEYPTCGKCVRGLLCASCNKRDALAGE